MKKCARSSILLRNIHPSIQPAIQPASQPANPRPYLSWNLRPEPILFFTSLVIRFSAVASFTNYKHDFLIRLKAYLLRSFSYYIVYIQIQVQIHLHSVIFGKIMRKERPIGNVLLTGKIPPLGGWNEDE